MSANKRRQSWHSVTRRSFLAASLLSAVGQKRSGGADEPKDVSWLDEIQRPPEKLPADAPRLTPLLVDASGAPIRSVAEWEKKRTAIREWWWAYLGGSLRSAYEVDPPLLERVRKMLQPTLLQHEIVLIGEIYCSLNLVRYESEPGVAVEAYVLQPKNMKTRPPGVVVLHSTTPETIRQPAGLAGEPELHFGLQLARRGFLAICPRCFLWQDKQPYHEQVAQFQRRNPGAKGMAKMLHDARVAVDFLPQLGADMSRIGAVGHSLGAKEVLYLAAFDERIKAAVSCEGGIGIGFSNWEAPWYLGPDVKRPDFGHDHHELLAMVAPRPFLLIGGDSADGDRSWPYIDAALPVYRLYDKTAPVGLFNHRSGHKVTALAGQRIIEWFETYL